MARLRTEEFQVLESRRRITGVHVGQVVGLSRDGTPLVDYSGNPFGPVTARRTASISRKLLRQALAGGLDVLLAFENNDPGIPVIFDLLEGKKVRRSRGAGKRAREAARGAADAPETRLGRIASVRDGSVYVDFEGNRNGPLPARTTVPLRNLKDEVLLVFPSGGNPVIVGQVYPAVPMEAPGSEDSSVVLKGQRIRIEAETELVLVAGRSKIHLDGQGKAVTTADQVVSRARGANKVQGGSVQLN